MAATQTPEVLWAQRSSATDEDKNYVYLTISVPDVPKDKLKLDLTATGLSFTGESTSKKTKYHVEMEFYADIVPEKTKENHTAANLQLILHKKDLKEEFWPRLLKDKAKVHYLRTDFDKWVDEDEQNEAPEDDYMNQFGGMGGGMGGGMPGMGGGDGGFGGIDFSKLGAGGDMPGMEGLGGAGGIDDDEAEEESDGEMPDLEEEADSKGKSKIEEVK